MAHGIGRVAVRAALLASAALVLAACTTGPDSGPVVVTPSETAESTTPAASIPPVLAPVGDAETIAEGLAAPWSILRLPDGGVLISERDAGRIVEVLDDGSLREVAVVPGVVSGGEGGLMGLAHLPGDDEQPSRVFAAYSTESDNRIVRMPLSGEPGALELGEPEVILDGLPRGGRHNGGRLAFGPDGYLYAGAGDAGAQDSAQDPDSLGGKILRMTPDGEPAPGNPVGTLVWSLGHRNPQGLAWDAAGGMWASEFGQDTWDELNRIEPGANYGWPVVEGRAGDARFVDPAVQWPTDEASPSGIAIVGDTVVIAALRGERLWFASPASTSPTDVSPAFAGEFGRFRDVVPGPDGEAWAITNNTDGRGSPRAGDDRLLRIPLEEAG
ncbi:glucose/arabinose dehydrogenase [Agromyces flavus]|uniref:Glucose/arabinose dehydrogenase n=1 Tax=Agromyces flavus TaxID=589382 RepID=A0A1H1LIZ2_9MICO|nr:PQQ-dependent sugar dehydrogenase [Agromyces flavus]MCP2368530.1 glucose/arabinose dehydrogenase [Agromyces flavus]GGI48229.1 oxidoreductase [Agromyces flavus]SDR74488.1 Glucose/arabinose dehydrogenase, beta-propeller fold [Agromyces flavus]